MRKIAAASIAGIVVATANLAYAQPARVPELFRAQSARHAAASVAVLPANVNGLLRDKRAQWAAAVSVDPKMLVDGQRDLALSLPEGARMHMRLAKSYKEPSGEVVWSGADRLQPDGRPAQGAQAPATALFVVRGQRVTGQIVAATGEVYELLTSEDGTQQYLVKRNAEGLESGDDTPAQEGLSPQTDADAARRALELMGAAVGLAKHLERGDGTPAPPDADAARRAADEIGALLSNSLVRVLQVYTPEAVTELGGQNSANDRAAFFIAQSNAAFANHPRLTLRFQSAGVRFASQEQATNISDTLVARIKATSDGWYDAYSTTERDSAKADLVALIVSDHLQSEYGDPTCGQAAVVGANASDAFFVLNHSCINFAFAHEAGHLFGARHETDKNTKPFRYAHGYIDGIGNFCTVMASGLCRYPRIGYFSTSSQSYSSGGAASRALGDSDYFDNERLLRERAPVVAAFR